MKFWNHLKLVCYIICNNYNVLEQHHKAFCKMGQNVEQDNFHLNIYQDMGQNIQDNKQDNFHNHYTDTEEGYL